MFATDAVHNSPTPQHHQERGQIAEQGEGNGLRARLGDAPLMDFANRSPVALCLVLIMVDEQMVLMVSATY
jgi:hypothetical protein